MYMQIHIQIQKPTHKHSPIYTNTPINTRTQKPILNTHTATPPSPQQPSTTPLTTLKKSNCKDCVELGVSSLCCCPPPPPPPPVYSYTHQLPSFPSPPHTHKHMHATYTHTNNSIPPLALLPPLPPLHLPLSRRATAMPVGGWRRPPLRCWLPRSLPPHPPWSPGTWAAPSATQGALGWPCHLGAGAPAWPWWWGERRGCRPRGAGCCPSRPRSRGWAGPAACAPAHIAGWSPAGSWSLWEEVPHDDVIMVTIQWLWWSWWW